MPNDSHRPPTTPAPSVATRAAPTHTATDGYGGFAERLRAAFEQSPVSTVVYDATGRPLAANPAFERLWGAGIADVPPAYSVLADPQLAAAGVLPLIRRAFAGEAVTVPPLRYEMGSAVGRGRVLWTQAHLFPVRDAAGRVEQVVLTHQDVTAQREAEAALADRNRRLELQAAELHLRIAEAERERAATDAARRRVAETFESITDPFFTVDREWRFTYVNPAAETVVGRPRAELLGKVLWEEFPEAVGSAYHTNALTAVRERRAVDFDAYYPPPLDLWTAMRIYPLADGAAVYYQDVTGRKRAEAALRESERQFRTMADALPALAFTGQPDGYIDWYNARWYEYTGATPEQMAGWGWQSVHDPAVLPAVLERWAKSIATGEPFEMTFPLRGADGRFRPFLTRVTPVRGADGAITRWFGTNTDVEAERAARDAAEQARARAERLQALTAALAGARTLDEVGAVVVAQGTEATGARTGMLAVRLPGSDEAVIVRQLGLTPSVLGRYARFPVTAPGPAAACLRTGEACFIESRDGPDGLLARFPEIPAVWESLRTHALASVPLVAAGEVVGAISFTFSAPRALPLEDREFFVALGGQAAQAAERVRLLDAEHAARAEAEEARARADEANRAKSQFLANMSHELRTPLNAIGGYAELLEMGLRGPVTEGQREDLARIQRAQRHLLGLINDVLNLARIETGRVEYDVQRVELAGVVADVAPMIEPQMTAKGLVFTVRPPGAGLAVWADPDKLRQVLLNVLSNAAKFTPTGGHITLDLAERADGSAPAGLVFVRVTDTGRGIRRDKLEAVFEPFVQIGRHLTSPDAFSQQGTGLGLAISRDLARGMGGDLRARSEEGRGSAFTITLRRASA